MVIVFKANSKIEHLHILLAELFAGIILQVLISIYKVSNVLLKLKVFKINSMWVLGDVHKNLFRKRSESGNSAALTVTNIFIS